MRNYQFLFVASITLASRFCIEGGIYTVDDGGKIEGKAVAIAVGDMMIVIAEDKDEVEVTYLDLTAAYILANA